MRTAPRWIRAAGVLAALAAAGGCAPLAIPAPSGRAPSAPAATLPMPGDPSPGACHRRGGLPDATCTPGDTDPRVTQASIGSTICARGWSASARPPLSVTEPIKRERMSAYGDTDSLAGTELDHLVPLELGGASTVRNLWPEPREGPDGATIKDQLENRLSELVCSGRLRLDDAQRAIATDWISAYRQYLGAIPSSVP